MPMMMPPWERPPGPWSERGGPPGHPGHPGHPWENFGPWGAPPFPDQHLGQQGPPGGGCRPPWGPFDGPPPRGPMGPDPGFGLGPPGPDWRPPFHVAHRPHGPPHGPTYGPAGAGWVPEALAQGAHPTRQGAAGARAWAHAFYAHAFSWSWSTMGRDAAPLAWTSLRARWTGTARPGTSRTSWLTMVNTRRSATRNAARWTCYVPTRSSHGSGAASARWTALHHLVRPFASAWLHAAEAGGSNAAREAHPSSTGRGSHV